MSNDLKFWLSILQIPNIGPQKFKKLYNYFSSMEAAYNAFGSELKDSGLDDKTIDQFIISRQKINPDKELEKINSENIKAITIFDESYPKPLKEIYSPPPVIFYKGNIENYNEYALAVVGSRKISSYGKQAINEILPPIIRSQITIVSGMAIGIDSYAHQCAIDLGQQTIAVLGSGLDSQNIYPPSNKHLLEKIVENNGIVITEFPYGTMPLKHNFPLRNRIISGLSKGVLVIEAQKNSGAMITAKYALDQNREVFSVPGSIFSPSCEGTNNLIKQGAKPVTCAEDILESLNLNEVSKFIENKKIIPESLEEEIILKNLNKEPVHIDQLARSSNLPAATLNATLALMEMKGKVRNVGNMMYVLNK